MDDLKDQIDKIIVQPSMVLVVNFDSSDKDELSKFKSQLDKICLQPFGVSNFYKVTITSIHAVVDICVNSPSCKYFSFKRVEDD